MTSFYWLVSLFALLGVWLNIRKHVSCFYIWAFTNAAWVYADITYGIWPQAALQAVYFILSIYGIVHWTKARSRDRTTSRICR